MRAALPPVGGAPIACLLTGLAPLRRVANAYTTRLFTTANTSGIDAADAILLIGSNPRVEAPVLNARIRAANLSGVPVAVVGQQVHSRDYSPTC